MCMCTVVIIVHNASSPLCVEQFSACIHDLTAYPVDSTGHQPFLSQTGLFLLS